MITNGQSNYYLKTYYFSDYLYLYVTFSSILVEIYYYYYIINFESFME